MDDFEPQLGATIVMLLITLTLMAFCIVDLVY